MTARIGIEEEFLLVDAVTGAPAPRVEAILPDARALAGDAVEEELHRAQIETATEPCATLAEASEQLLHLRAALAEAGRRHGIQVVASGTYPGPMGPEGEVVTPEDRYRAIAAENALIARRQLISGCHVHVSVDDEDAAARALTRIRRWLPHLLALSANSPFWEGRDSGYASYRSEVWSRWPVAGPPGPHPDAGSYWGLVDTLVSAGVIVDRGMVYWDARLSSRFQTLEVRVADVALGVNDAVTLAGLTRALVVQAGRDELVAPAPDIRPELLRAAAWRAARSGVDGELIDPLDGSRAPAGEAIEAMLDSVRESLDDLGDTDVVHGGVASILAGNGGAARQRRAHASGPDGVQAVLGLAAL